MAKTRNVSLKDLYTLRWNAQQLKGNTYGDEMNRILTDIIEENTAEDLRETPGENEILKPVLAVVVGHEKNRPGAALKGTSMYEYQYHTKVADKIKSMASMYNIDVEVIFRDSIGLSGAYEKVRMLSLDMCVELHFNAFNGKVTGTETLCSNKADDQLYAKEMQNELCRAFERSNMSRGVKTIPRKANGGFACYSLLDIPNCLVEPFFGDVPSEVEMALKNMDDYAEAVLIASSRYFKNPF